MVMRDIACAGYVAGCNTLFFAQDSEGAADYSTDNATKNMMERLSFSNDVGAKYASMLSFPATAQQFSSGHLDTVMRCAFGLLLGRRRAAKTHPSLSLLAVSRRVCSHGR